MSVTDRGMEAMLSRMTTTPSITIKPSSGESGHERSSGRGKSGARRASLTDIGKLFEKLPPHAIESEMSLLGAMLLDPQVIGDVVQIIRHGDDFFKSAHGAMYEAIVESYNENASVDLVTLNQKLVDRGILEAVGGQAYLIDIADSVPTAAHAEHYARQVREKAMVRQLIQTAGEIIHDAHHMPSEARGILDEAERKIFLIAERYENSDFRPLSELLDETLKWLQDTTDPVSGLLTGFTEYDQLTGGLQAGELTILAARPSMGKTALALNLAEQVASGVGRKDACPVGFFSLEMSEEQLVHRLIAGNSGVDVQDLRRNNLGGDKANRVMQAIERLQKAPMYVDDVPSLSLLQLRAKARRMKAKHGIEAIFVDYLQLVTSGSRAESRQIEVSEISRGLKALARELSVPVVCLAQLNRGPEQREGHRPRLSDLRESGSIEQDADVVLLLHREAYFHKDDPDWKRENEERARTSEVIIAKQRNGPTGVVYLTWDEKITRFKNQTRINPPPGYADDPYAEY